MKNGLGKCKNLKAKLVLILSCISCDKSLKEAPTQFDNKCDRKINFPVKWVYSIGREKKIET